MFNAVTIQHAIVYYNVFMQPVSYKTHPIISKEEMVESKKENNTLSAIKKPFIWYHIKWIIYNTKKLHFSALQNIIFPSPFFLGPVTFCLPCFPPQNILHTAPSSICYAEPTFPFSSSCFFCTHSYIVDE